MSFGSVGLCAIIFSNFSSQRKKCAKFETVFAWMPRLTDHELTITNDCRCDINFFPYPISVRAKSTMKFERLELNKKSNLFSVHRRFPVPGLSRTENRVFVQVQHGSTGTNQSEEEKEKEKVRVHKQKVQSAGTHKGDLLEGAQVGSRRSRRGGTKKK